MMMPAAIAGALIAGNTGQPKARVLLDRSHLGASERVCPSSLPTTHAGRGSVSGLRNQSLAVRSDESGVYSSTAR
jgi:hypothetical protein